MKYVIRLTNFYLVILVSFGGCADKNENTYLAGNTATLFNPNWAESKLWDDGLAEVAIYTAERTIYNKKRAFDFTYITVKEDFNEQYSVKTDDYKRKDLFPVMKVNAFCRISSDNYPYHYLTSLFFKLENAVKLYKLTSSSQEWCGNTFKAINADGNKFKFTFNSYWDKQGEGQLDLDGNILFEDQLPYSLRSLKFKDGLTFTLPVAEFLQTNKATTPNISQGTFRINHDKDSTDKPTWRVTLILTPEKQNTYWFSIDEPHLLLRQKTWDGRTLELKEVKRYAYWQH